MTLIPESLCVEDLLATIACWIAGSISHSQDFLFWKSCNKLERCWKSTLVRSNSFKQYFYLTANRTIHIIIIKIWDFAELGSEPTLLMFFFVYYYHSSADPQWLPNWPIFLKIEGKKYHFQDFLFWKSYSKLERCWKSTLVRSNSFKQYFYLTANRTIHIIIIILWNFAELGS